jgi:hypothetical protein
MVKKIILIGLLLYLVNIELIFCQVREEINNRNIEDKETDNKSCPVEVKDFKANVADKQAMSNATSTGSLGGHMRSSGTLGNNTTSGQQQKVTFSLTLENPLTNKNVKEIYWDATFLNGQNQAVIEHFHSKKKIKSGKKEIIEETVFANVNATNSNARLGFRLIKLCYEDNSCWENSDREFPFYFQIKVQN